MHLIDLSQPLFDGSPNCPGHPPVEVRLIANHAEHGWKLEHLNVATHTASHIDAPCHRMPNGKSLDQMPLETFVGPAFIADLRGVGEREAILKAHLEKSLPAAEGRVNPLADAIVLLATGWGDLRAKTEQWESLSPFLSPEGADYLAARGVRGVGIDHYSIGGSGPENEATHEALLGRGIWIVEELFFPASVFALPQPCQFWALPVNFGPGASGAFCRPVIVAGGTVL